jgi:hypothetical protein
MAVDPKQYLDELLRDAGVAADDPKRQAIFDVFSNEKVSKKLADDVMRQSDYSRAQDELRTKTQRNEAFYADMLTKTDANQKVLNEWAAKVKQYETEYGALDDNGNGQRQVVQSVQTDFISRKDYDAEKQRTEANFIGILKTGLKIASQHMYEFKEPLDVDALEKVAVEKNVSLQQAYDQWVGPRRIEQQKAQFDAEKQKFADEKVREFASTHKVPLDQGPREYHPIFDRDPKKQVGAEDYVPNSGQLSPQATRNLRDNFVEAWNTAPVTNTSG